MKVSISKQESVSSFDEEFSKAQALFKKAFGRGEFNVTSGCHYWKNSSIQLIREEDGIGVFIRLSPMYADFKVKTFKQFQAKMKSAAKSATKDLDKQIKAMEELKKTVGLFL